MSEFMNTIDLLGDEATAKALIERTITEFNDNICESVGVYAFYECKALTSVDLPNATSIGHYAFYNCSALTSVNIPNATSVGNNAFYECKALTSVDLPNATSVGNSAFICCSKLTTIILRSPTVCTLANTNAFNGTPFASSGGTVYCPASLITQYQQATNWSTLYSGGKCNFVAIEGSEYE